MTCLSNHRMAALAVAVAAILALSGITVAGTDAEPIVSAFVLPRQSAGLIFPVTELRVVGEVAGYQITSTPIPPAASQADWSAQPPKSITAPGPGVYDYYAWAKDGRGRVSLFAAQTVDVATRKITVGPKGRDFTNFVDAIAAIAAKGNPKGVVIEADADEYPSWRAENGYADNSLKNIIKVVSDNLTIRGVGGRAQLAAPRTRTPASWVLLL